MRENSLTQNSQSRAPLAALIAVCVLSDCMALLGAGADSAMKDVMRSQREYFLTNYSRRLDTNSQTAVWLNAFLLDLGKAVERSQADWVLALRRLVSLGKQEQLFGKSTGFVEDAQVLELLISALKERDSDAREFAASTLAWQIRDKDLARFADVVKSSLGAPRSNDEYLLLGKLPLEKKERLEMIAQGPPLLSLKARLGDTVAQRELIQTFREETNYYAKAKLARALGYAATRPCAEALVDAFRSNVSTKGRSDERSIRIDVLLALGQIYQEEPLFTRDARLLADNSDSTVDRFRGLTIYIAEVDAWTEKNFGHRAWGDEQVWFVRFLNTPRIEYK